MEQKKRVVIGLDEAGRGAFFSRIYSAAVVHDPDLIENAVKNKIVIRDSKKMTPRQRSLSFDYLIQNTLFGVGWCDEKEIDNLGITRCNILSMHRAIENLLEKHPEIEIVKIHVDGVLFRPFHDIPHETIIRGETTHPEIAMASILAKTHRDYFIMEMCDNNPSIDENYGIRSNKGYGTAKHIAGIKKHGPHSSHRNTFIKNHYHLRFL